MEDVIQYQYSEGKLISKTRELIEELTPAKSTWNIPISKMEGCAGQLMIGGRVAEVQVSVTFDVDEFMD